MSLVSILVVLIVFGLILWLIQTYLPIAEPIKTIIVVIVVLILILLLLSMIGLIPNIRIT